MTVARSCKLQTDHDGILILTIREKRGRKEKVDHYRVERNPNAKRAYRLHKAVHADDDPILYDVLIDGENSTCDCLGNLSHGHCRHCESLLALIESGKLK